MAVKAQKELALTEVLAARWQQACRKIEELGEVLPDEKYEWRPQSGIRTCGEVLRHVAFWHQYVADSLRGKEVDESLNEVPAAAYPAKAKILDLLRRTGAEAGAAIGEQDLSRNLKTTELVMTFLEHTSEHYGQLVVYARLLGLVPPASRQ